MSRFRFNITMSLDGYVAGPNQSLANPLGEGGEELHEWIVGLRSFRERHGKSIACDANTAWYESN